ncbi:MAG: hypothetical protein PVG30_02000 [Gammaproteobacteria bacterium]|jgi:hypothetical protein
MFGVYMIVNTDTKKIDSIFFRWEKEELKEYLKSDKCPGCYEIIVSEKNMLTSLSKIEEEDE